MMQDDPISGSSNAADAKPSCSLRRKELCVELGKAVEEGDKKRILRSARLLAREFPKRSDTFVRVARAFGTVGEHEKAMLALRRARELAENPSSSGAADTTTSRPPRAHVLDLPTELLLGIFEYFDTPDIAQFQRVCKTWRGVARSSPKLWSRLVIDADRMDKKWPVYKRQLETVRLLSRDTCTSLSLYNCHVDQAPAAIEDFLPTFNVSKLQTVDFRVASSFDGYGFPSALLRLLTSTCLKDFTFHFDSKFYRQPANVDIYSGLTNARKIDLRFCGDFVPEKSTWHLLCAAAVGIEHFAFRRGSLLGSLERSQGADLQTIRVVAPKLRVLAVLPTRSTLHFNRLPPPGPTLHAPVQYLRLNEDGMFALGPSMKDILSSNLQELHVELGEHATPLLDNLHLCTSLSDLFVYNAKRTQGSLSTFLDKLAITPDVPIKSMTLARFYEQDSAAIYKVVRSRVQGQDLCTIDMVHVWGDLHHEEAAFIRKNVKELMLIPRFARHDPEEVAAACGFPLKYTASQDPQEEHENPSVEQWLSAQSYAGY